MEIFSHALQVNTEFNSEGLSPLHAALHDLKH